MIEKALRLSNSFLVNIRYGIRFIPRWVIVACLICVVSSICTVVSCFVKLDEKFVLMSLLLNFLGGVPALIYSTARIWIINRQLIRNNGVARPPAHNLVSIFRFLFPKKAFDNIFSQVIADGREEIFEALAGGKALRSQWLHFVLYMTLVYTAASWSIARFGRVFVVIWKATN